MSNLTQPYTEAIEKMLDAEDSEPQERGLNRASAAGWLYDCTRHLVLKRLAPDKEVFSREQKRRFSEGRRQETIMRSDFQKAGVAMREFKTREERFAALAKVIPGAEVKLEPDDIFIENIPVDYKSCSSVMFREIKRYEVAADLRRSKALWIRHYPVQMNIYCAAFSAPVGLMPFKDKEAGGVPHIIECPYNAGDFAFVYDGLNEINKLVKSENAPPVIDDWEVCGSCGFKDYCHPDEKPTVKTAGVSDPETAAELITLLEHHRQLLDAGAKRQAKELDEAYDAIKEIVAGLGEVIQIGDYRVTLQKTTDTKYEIPPEIKAKYKKVGEKFKPMKIEFFGGAI